MTWKDELKNDPIPWLMEPGTPGVRYLVMRDLLDIPADDPELDAARADAHSQGPIAAILAEMNPEGYWVEPGAGYNPKYRSTVWSIITLAQLGACASQDERISKACSYIFEHTLVGSGQFTTNGAPSGTADCLQGNLCWALLELGCDVSLLARAFDWMARSVTGEGIAPAIDRKAPVRYYAAKCGPNFACGANNNLSCAWGAAKVMLAFSSLTAALRTAPIERAISQGIDFLFSTDPAKADYPSGYSDKPSGNWWKFGFPVFYVTDLLQIVEALVKLGYRDDPRLANALEIVRQKQNGEGRWELEYDYVGKIWADFGLKKSANKWVTLRALRVLKAV